MPQHDVPSALRRFWQTSYAADYVGFGVLLTAYLLTQFLVEPFHRMFSLDNQAIQFPYAEVERVPVSWMFGYAGGVPLAIFIIWAAMLKPGWHKTHVTVLGLFISLVLTSFITDVVKNAVGRPRPDLLARCDVEPGTPKNSLVTFVVCRETNHHKLHDGWRSFPSGHSSFAFSGLGYLAMFLAGQMHIFRPRTDLARVLVALAPLLCAALIAISRCEDYRHDVYDVTIGSLLGISVAHFTYRRYYPGLRSSRCDIPFPNVPDTISNGFKKLRDEEERIQSASTFTVDDLEEEDEGRIPLRESSRDRNRNKGSNAGRV